MLQLVNDVAMSGNQIQSSQNSVHIANHISGRYQERGGVRRLSYQKYRRIPLSVFLDEERGEEYERNERNKKNRSRKHKDT